MVTLAAVYPLGPDWPFYLTPVGGSLAPSTGHPPADEGERTSPAPSSSAPGGGD